MTRNPKDGDSGRRNKQRLCFLRTSLFRGDCKAGRRCIPLLLALVIVSGCQRKLSEGEFNNSEASRQKQPIEAMEAASAAPAA
jgi:hypothetical protein